MKKPILIALSATDFDPSEAAIPWQVLREHGLDVVFATAGAQVARADPRMLSGEGLDPWGFVPGLNKLKLFGLILRANKAARQAHARMILNEAFLKPLSFDALVPEDFSGLLLPGGHAKGMRPYLEDETLQRFVAAFFESVREDGRPRPVAAVCHGVLVAARARSPKTGRSPLHGKKTTALTWQLERSAWNLTRYLCRFWDPNYYRTYLEAEGEPAGYWSVEAEVKRVLANEDDFLDVPAGAPAHRAKTDGLHRDSLENEAPAFIVRDGAYFSGRWPGDIHALSKALLEAVTVVEAPEGD